MPAHPLLQLQVTASSNDINLFLQTLHVCLLLACTLDHGLDAHHTMQVLFRQHVQTLAAVKERCAALQQAADILEKGMHAAKSQAVPTMLLIWSVRRRCDIKCIGKNVSNASI